MAFVYWIHLKEHTDIFCEGYVGYTSKTVEDRWKGHLKELKSSRCPNYPLYNSIKKYREDIVVTTVVEGSNDYCLDIEGRLRPNVKIGWNLHVGGNKGFKGDTHSDEAKAKISLAGKGRKFSQEHRDKIGEANKLRVVKESTKITLSEQRLGISRSDTSKINQRETLKNYPWKNHKADKNIWLLADVYFEEYTKNTSMGAKRFSKIFNLKESQIHTILEKFRSGWVPTESPYWLEFKNNIKEADNAQAQSS